MCFTYVSATYSVPQPSFCPSSTAVVSACSCRTPSVGGRRFFSKTIPGPETRQQGAVWPTSSHEAATLPPRWSCGRINCHKLLLLRGNAARTSRAESHSGRHEASLLLADGPTTFQRWNTAATQRNMRNHCVRTSHPYSRSVSQQQSFILKGL